MKTKIKIFSSRNVNYILYDKKKKITIIITKNKIIVNYSKITYKQLAIDIK